MFCSFLQCLCDRSKKLCRQDYQLVTILNYIADGNPTSEDITEGDATGHTFLCHPGRFSNPDSVSCVRSSDALSWCEDQTYCQPVYVLTSYATCASSCISMEWISTSFNGLNFSGNPEFVGGSCPPEVITTQGPVEPILATSDPQTKCSDHINGLEIATFTVVIIIVILIVSSNCIIFQSIRNKKKIWTESKQNTSKYNVGKKNQQNSEPESPQSPENRSSHITGDANPVHEEKTPDVKSKANGTRNKTQPKPVPGASEDNIGNSGNRQGNIAEANSFPVLAANNTRLPPLIGERQDGNQV